MARPLSISRTDIEHWADRYDASGTLPVLIRRLLLATTPLASIDVRGDSGTRLGGWDVEVLSRGETPWCPSGMSVWEVSVSGDVKKKLDEDFDKRTKAPELSVDPKRVTYIAVTARSFDKKKIWAKEKKAKGAWADVRVYDADDLATWLEQAPVVGMWFGSTELGRLTHEICTIEDFLHEFSQASMPPLPPSILLSGDKRTQQARELLQALVKRDEALRSMSKERPLPMRIGAESTEEALLFVAATLSLPVEEAESLRERTLIVKTQEAFRYYLHAQTLEPLVLLPNFAYALSGKTVGPRVQAVLPVSWKDEIGAREGLKLDLIPYAPLERALAAAGFAYPGRLARDADGRWSKLRELLMGTIRGQRMSDISPEQIALLLVGAWKPTQEADRAVMRQLEADPDKAERLSAALTQGDEPMLEAHDNYDGTKTYRWVSPRAGWKQHGKHVTESDLKRFFQVAQEVLKPSFELAENDGRARIEAMIEARRSGVSQALRSGIAASIAWLAVADEDGHVEGRWGANFAIAMLRQLMEPKWEVWAALSSILPELAEAAPVEFLQCLFDSLDAGDAGLGSLFSSPNRGGAGRVLAALETLAWKPEAFELVVLALERLDAHDQLPEHHSSRPFNSLLEILHPLMPQSSTSAQKRIDAIRLVLKRHEALGWRLCVSSLRSLVGGSISSTERPRYRRWVDTGEQPWATPGEAEMQVNALITLVIEHAGDDPVRWAALIGLPHSRFGWRVLDDLDAKYLRVRENDCDAILWDAVRDELGRAARSIGLDKHAEGREFSPDLREWWSRLKKLYEKDEPTDLVVRFRWLFDESHPVPDPIPDGNDNRRDERMQNAIEELGKQSDRWKLLERLAAHLKEKRPQYLLGHTLARASYTTQVEAALLEVPPTLNLGGSVSYFWATRLRMEGFPWFERLLRTLVERGRVDDAANVLLLDGGSEQIWDWVDQIGEPLQSTYWKKHDPLWLDHVSESGYEHGVRCLLEVGRVEEARAAAGQGAEHARITSATILDVLDALRQGPLQWRDEHLQSYDMERLFKALDNNPDIDDDRIIELEITHAERIYEREFLGRPKRGARRFFEKIKRSPEYFVSVLRRMHSPKDIDDNGTISTERRNLRGLLRAWRGYPGEDLPTAEREATLEMWCNEVLQQAADVEKEARHYLEVMLARVDVAEDGHWPCLAARQLLESGRIRDLNTAMYNSRGSWERGFGERQKPLRALAEEYEAGANALRGKYPKTAAMLDAMARGRVREAVQVETEERREHIAWGEQERGDAEARKKQSPSTSLRPNALPDSPLTRLEVRHVGPAPEFVLDLAPRLNLFTGDNSLGKTFILDVLWWTLTGSWVGHPAKPEPKRTKNGKIAKSKAAIIAQSGSHTLTGTYNALHERWSTQNDGPLAPGLVIYAHVDGGFSIWDPIRNVTPIAKDELDLSAGYHFSPQELWEGKTSDDKSTVLCKGLREDLVDWPRDQEQRETMELLNKVLQRISPPGEGIEIGDAARFKVRDARDVPRLKLPYGLVFAEHASAAVKRMLSLAYALVWSVTEVRRAAPMAELDPLQNITFLIDEIEAHLHPKWQRTILRALLELANDIAPMAKAQLVVTTHAPLVLVSIQNIVDDKQDALFDFDLETIEDGPNQTRKVSVIEREPWELHGDVNAWLASEIFNETHVLSKEQEDAIDNASRLLEEPTPDKKRGREAFDELVKTLGPAHPQLLRFRYLAEKKGWLS